jgi:hypothetical protein
MSTITIARATLELALEALEGNTTNPVIDPEQAAIEDQAIAVIKQALEQPVQEPTFWLNEHGQLAASRRWAERTWRGQKLIPLYTTPPAPAPVPLGSKQ